MRRKSAESSCHCITFVFFLKLLCNRDNRLNWFSYVIMKGETRQKNRMYTHLYKLTVDVARSYTVISLIISTAVPLIVSLIVSTVSLVIISAVSAGSSIASVISISLIVATITAVRLLTFEINATIFEIKLII